MKATGIVTKKKQPQKIPLEFSVPTQLILRTSVNQKTSTTIQTPKNKTFEYNLGGAPVTFVLHGFIT